MYSIMLSADMDFFFSYLHPIDFLLLPYWSSQYFERDIGRSHDGRRPFLLPDFTALSFPYL